MHVDSTSFPAVMLINSDAGRSEASAYIPGICKPLHTSSGISHHCSVVYISLYGKHARDPIEIGEDRVHCDAEKQDRKRSPHVDSSNYHFRRQQFALHLVPTSSEEKNMSGIHDDPQGSLTRGKDL